jgi:prepilin-type N-terminal cleavage/methylation domain-containing protein
MKLARNNRRGFSLLELVIVVMIIGIIAAIAIPRMSRGSAGAADSALSGNLSVLRSAIDLYSAEHAGKYPTAAAIADQLTKYTDDSGATADAKDATHIYGPYMRKVPALPVSCPRKGCTGIAAADAATIGWIYNDTTGVITANCTTETDATGKLYTAY